MDETTLKLSKVIEDKDIAIKELSKQLTGYYTCTKAFIEKIILTSFQVKYRVLRIMLVHM